MCNPVCWRLYRVGFVCPNVLEVLEVLRVPEVMRCVLLCTLEAMEEALFAEVLEALDVPEALVGRA